MNYKTGALLLLFISSSFASTNLIAQDKPAKKEKSEKVKSDTKEKTTIIIDGDEITVNGKPISEYEGDNIVIRKRNRDVEVHGGYSYTTPRVHVSPRVAIAPVPPMNYNYNFSWDDGEKTRTVRSSRAQLGVTTEKDARGVKVTDVVNESAAAKAGIKDGDIITSVDGEKIVDADDLYEAISEKKPGQEVEVGYIRDKKALKQKIKLGEQKYTTTTRSNSYFRTPQAFGYGSPDVAITAPRIRSDVGGFNFYSSAPKLGVRIEDTEAGDGVRVLYVEEGSIAEKSGIKENDIITMIDSVEIKDTNRARNALMEAGEKQNFSIVVKRSGSPMKLEVKIPKRLNKTDL